MKLALVLFFVALSSANASVIGNCFDTFQVKKTFNHFEVLATEQFVISKDTESEFVVNEMYTETVVRAYANLIHYIQDEKYSGGSRSRPISIVHMTDEEFQAALSLLHSSNFNGAADFHSEMPKNLFRMYVNHALNEHCNKDFILVRELRYADVNFTRYLAHEMFHILRKQSCGDCTTHLWLEEGLAEYVATKISGIRPNTAISSFLRVRSPISFFEVNPARYSMANYGQSFLFLDLLFRDDVVAPNDSIHHGLLKDFIKSGSTSCGILRVYFNTSILNSKNEDDLSCEEWKQIAYKEFVFSLVDENLSRGFTTYSIVGTFGEANFMPSGYSFTMIDVTDHAQNFKDFFVQSQIPVESIFMIQTANKVSHYVSKDELYSTLQQYYIPNRHVTDPETKIVKPAPYNIKKVLLAVFNFSNQEGSVIVSPMDRSSTTNTSKP